MANLVVKGGNKLSGTITPSGNKNAALPIICAALLTKEEVTLRNVPDLTDINQLVDLLISLGVKIYWDKDSKVMVIDSSQMDADTEEFPLGMRGAILLFPPLLYRRKNLNVNTNIGGCSLGIREIDPHLDMMEKMGAKLTYGDSIDIELKDTFEGGELWPDYMSVTATENFAMAAAIAKGKSVMVNAASEPHVQDLCNFLISMGAKIEGVGSSTLNITGVESLKGTDFTISSDHHEITTLLALGAMTGGEVKVTNAIPEHFPLIVRAFEKLGVEVVYEGDVAVVKSGQKLEIERPFTKNLLQKIEAAPWPYFPADLMPLMVALAVKSEGSIMFWNKLYEGGFLWIPEMIKFGAHIVMADPHRIITYGGKELSPASVDAPNIIRATVALMMVALTVEGESVIRDADSIKRAHPHFIENLNSLGADIRWKE